MGLVSSGADYTRLDEMRKIVKKSRRFGFSGSSCIHPAVVPILNQEFTPNEGEIAKARVIIDEFQKAIGAGRASLEVDGKMVDYPVVYRAQNLIRIADNIAKKEAAIEAD